MLLENLLRWEDGKTVTGSDLQAIADWLKNRRSEREIQYRPARILMQDFTSVPDVVDLAAMRDAMAEADGHYRGHWQGQHRDVSQGVCRGVYRQCRVASHPRRANGYLYLAG